MSASLFLFRSRFSYLYRFSSSAFAGRRFVGSKMAEAEAAPAMAARRVIIPLGGKCKAEIVWAMIQTDRSSDFVMVDT